MKKIISLTLIVLLFISLIVGCDSVNDYYSVTVTGSEDSLMEPLKRSYKVGETVEIKAYSVTDVSLHVFVNGVEIPMTHFDSDYWGFEFVMPSENVTIHLTYDEFYGKDEYEFNDLWSGIDCLNEEIIKVSVKLINYSEKYSFVETRYSYQQIDIDKFKSIAKEELIKIDNSIASNASCGYEYSFYYNTESHGERCEVLEFNDSFYTWYDFSSWQAFKFMDENYTLPTIEDPDLISYSFKYDGRSSDVRKYDDESFSLQYFDIGTVEFVLYESESYPSNAKYYLDSGYGKINLLSSDIFELNGQYYQIISGEEYWAYSYCRLGE